MNSKELGFSSLSILTCCDGALTSGKDLTAGMVLLK